LGTILRRSRAVIRKFNTNQDFFHSARLVLREEGIVVETFWHNREVAGVWLFVYDVTPPCYASLVLQDLIEIVSESEDGVVFQLTQKGKQRLG
jgi:hypothetical protein